MVTWCLTQGRPRLPGQEGRSPLPPPPPPGPAAAHPSLLLQSRGQINVQGFAAMRSCCYHLALSFISICSFLPHGPNFQAVPRRWEPYLLLLGSSWDQKTIAGPSSQGRLRLLLLVTGPLAAATWRLEMQSGRGAEWGRRGTERDPLPSRTLKGHPANQPGWLRWAGQQKPIQSSLGIQASIS